MKYSAYIHRICALNDVEVFRTDKDVTYLRLYDVLEILGEVKGETKPSLRGKSEINDVWKYYALMKYFKKCQSASVTLTFREIEKILKAPLLPCARKHKSFWYPHPQYNRIAETWLKAGYSLKKIDMDKGKITLHRGKSGMSNLQIPDVLLNGCLPENAVYELETHMKYIIQKYGL